MAEMSFLFDESLCVACDSCRMSCKEWNALESVKNAASSSFLRPLDSSLWIKNSLSRGRIVHLMCRHCRIAECEKACPEKAIYDENGFKVIDQKKCIGCGACEKACPYNAVHVNLSYPSMKNKKAYKCHGCVSNPDDVPHCALNCPTGALRYGYRKKLVAEAQERLHLISKKHPSAVLYGLGENGGHSVLSLLFQPPSFAAGFGADEEARMVYRMISPMLPPFSGLRREIYKVISALKG